MPGDRHVLIGTKEGNIELYDLASAECISTVKAHTGKDTLCVWFLRVYVTCVIARLLWEYNVNMQNEFMLGDSV